MSAHDPEQVTTVARALAAHPDCSEATMPDRSTTPADAARYAAHLAHDVDRPSIHDLTDDDARLPIVREAATCGVCGQGVADPLWCVTCANDKAAEMRQRNEEWFR